MRLEHPEEDIKWIVEGRANRDLFLAIFPRHNGRDCLSDFLKLRSKAPAWVTRDSTHFITSVHWYSNF